MFSLNVPVPGSVARIAADLRPALVDAGVERFRDRHSLVVKRFEGEESLPRLRERLRTAIAGEPAFEARVAGVDAFEDPPRGPGPVVYLVVDSPGLVALHDRLVDRFGAVAGLEGDDYTPHVTLGRGGRGNDRAVDRGNDRAVGRGGGHAVDDGTLAALSERVEPVTWTVSELAVYDSRYRETVSRLSLPA